MSNQKISELTALSMVSPSDQFAAVTGGVTKSVTAVNLRNSLRGWTTPSGSFTSIGSPTVSTNSWGDIILTGTAAGSGANVCGHVVSAPATPWSFTVYFDAMMLHKAFQSYGLCFRESSSGKLHIFDMLAADLGLTVLTARSTKFTSPTSFSADYLATQKVGTYANWMRVRDDGSNRLCQLSPDGENWFTLHSIGRTDFITADQAGIVVGLENSASPQVAPIVCVRSLTF